MSFKVLGNALLLGLCGLFLAGCPNQPAPNPGDTVLGDEASTGASSTWAPGGAADFSAARAVGLEGRGDFASDLTAGEQLEGILPDIYFDYDQSFIRPDQRPALAEAAAYLNDNSQANLLIEGHCDYKGTTEYNLALGDRRANSVKNYLVQLGIDADRLETLSKGDLEAVPDATDAQRAKDRRAELIVVPG
ncbi:MAG: OmpA family protein [Opitutales bacterium]